MSVKICRRLSDRCSGVPSLLAIDDDHEMIALLAEYLKPEGFQVDAAYSAEQGLEKATKSGYDLILLDVMLPGINGFEALRRLRTWSQIPVLMLTARGEETDRIVGLEIGADDYLPKPFNLRELSARIQAILRRSARVAPTSNASVTTVVLGEIELDHRSRQVKKDGAPIDLTTAEFDLLRVMLDEPGVIHAREKLFEKVLGRPYNIFDRSIDNHISSLRKKLGAFDDGTERIKNIRGVGYLYAILQN